MIEKIRIKKGEYQGVATIVDDPVTQTQFIVIARDNGQLQRAVTRIALKCNLSTKKFQEVSLRSISPLT